jgi:hypothetical protein
VKNDEIKNICSEYFDKLFNEESEKIATELDDSFANTSGRLFGEFKSLR